MISYRPSLTFHLVNPEEGPILEHFTGLRSLQLAQLGTRNATSEFYSPYLGPDWLKQQLQSILGATRLQHIKFKIVVEEDPNISRDAWAAVDSIFDGDTFPELTRFEINPVCFRDDDYWEPWRVIHDKVESFFPRLQERKVLDVCLPEENSRFE
jgi:hypothetical protein